MKIYTKTGDSGETGLLGGIRVPKDHVCVDVCGTLDELNSILGLVRSESIEVSVDQPLATIQSHLFDLGSRVAASLSETSHVAGFAAERSSWIESLIDQFEQSLPAMTAFILPGGCRASSYLHLARSVCRRAERRMVSLMQLDLKRSLETEMIYLNRLSDALFVMARLVNLHANAEEVKWLPEK